MAFLRVIMFCIPSMFDHLGRLSRSRTRTFRSSFFLIPSLSFRLKFEVLSILEASWYNRLTTIVDFVVNFFVLLSFVGFFDYSEHEGDDRLAMRQIVHPT